MMQMDELDVKMFNRDQSQNQVVVNEARREENGRTLAVESEIINESESSKSQAPASLMTTESASTRQIAPSIEQSRGSSELPRTISRTEAVRQDVKRLKSVTLNRMGKIFKTHTPSTIGKSSLDLDSNVRSVDNYEEKASVKEKTNSLGRMFKLVDKDGSPRKLFARPRTGSLSRILRRYPRNEENGVTDKSTEDSGRGIFSRILSQLRGK
ncbi:uncharacterized protein LOC114928523 [Nylanderia fulva]|uniref:uncharacterized protein LOC114928523 n=1 Tax=Nylanderia fulva TaxID=613905 RepID=UPI0010FB9D2E|nr:uncharacterized protein LOC114928523 [Nylanderia fulva]